MKHRLWGFFWLMLTCVMSSQVFAQFPTNMPFGTSKTHLTIHNGVDYSPFTVKGTNLGIAVPGTFPGELRATAADYSRWFTDIKAAGFNTIRLYTLHYPAFYETLDSFNRTQPNNPLYFFQGVWLEEEIPNYQYDLYELTSIFEQEIRDNVNAVHGNNSIASRPGKAHGSYTVDVSQWNVAYIIGREIYPDEVLTANANHPGDRQFLGEYLQIQDGDPAEVWITTRMDYLLTYEKAQYGTQRPISASSWPTLDPIAHPFEPNRGEDTAQIDINKIDFSRAPAGIFASYHAYPYYPDFVSQDPAYQGVSDAYGPNSYLAYLRDLKSHYQNMPLLIAEYGVPSSWGIAHFAQSGMHHGGLNELDQGKLNMRLLENILESDCAGGIHFAWMDEWFKRTWINDPTDYIADSRIIWHNITSAEQNFGLIGYRRPGVLPQPWATYNPTDAVQSLAFAADPTFVRLQLTLRESLRNVDTLWLALDTYADSLGERLLPTGDTLAHGAEFLLRITNGAADLYVTEAYDTYGIWHNTAAPQQLFRSTASTGAPWKPVRWRNNTGEAEIQYIGHLKVAEPLAPVASDEAVRITGRNIDIRLPWTLLNVVAPDAFKVLHRRNGLNDTLSDGIRISSLYRQQLQQTPSRNLWQGWTNVLDAAPFEKQSYAVMQARQPLLPGLVVAKMDEYYTGINQTLEVSVDSGLLYNDITTEMGPVQLVVETLPIGGQLLLGADGAFVYVPKVDFYGFDFFNYRLRQGNTLSDLVPVKLRVMDNGQRRGFVQLYPNPTTDFIKIDAPVPLQQVVLLDAFGRTLGSWDNVDPQFELPVGAYAPGTYWLQLRTADQLITRKFVRIKP